MELSSSSIPINSETSKCECTFLQIKKISRDFDFPPGKWHGNVGTETINLKKILHVVSLCGTFVPRKENSFSMHIPGIYSFPYLYSGESPNSSCWRASATGQQCSLRCNCLQTDGEFVLQEFCALPGSFFRLQTPAGLLGLQRMATVFGIAQRSSIGERSRFSGSNRQRP